MSALEAFGLVRDKALGTRFGMTAAALPNNFKHLPGNLICVQRGYGTTNRQH